MKAPTVLQEKDPRTGQATGATSLARVLAGVFGLLAAAVLGSYLYLALAGQESPFTFWQALLGSVVLGAVAVGFYRGRGGRLFDGVTDSVVDRLRNQD